VTNTNDQALGTPSRIEHFSSHDVIDMAQRLIEWEINLDDRDAVIEAMTVEYCREWDPLDRRPGYLETAVGGRGPRQLWEAEEQRRKSCHERGERCAWEPYISSELGLWIERYCDDSGQARHWWSQYWRAVHNPVWLASNSGDRRSSCGLSLRT
jgi:hypothetical protein